MNRARAFSSALPRGSPSPAVRAHRSTRCCPPPPPVVCRAEVERLADDLTRYVPEEGVIIYGVDHYTSNSEPAELILRSRPAACVVESAITLEHGSSTGNAVTLPSLEQQMESEPHIRMYTGLARQLAREPRPQVSPGWRQIKGEMCTEQLAWLASLAVGVPLVYGDVPKRAIFERMMSEPSLGELDEAFGRGLESNFLYLLARYPEHSGVPASAAESTMSPGPLIEDIIFGHRDRALVSAVRQARLKYKGPVVAVVGELHMVGMKALFEADSAAQAAAAAKKAAPAVPLDKGLACGVRRALVERALQMVCNEDFVADLDREFGTVTETLSAEEQERYNGAVELFGLTRVILASLPRELLSKIFVGLKGDAWDMLEPFRKLRPSRGGAGYSSELVELQRSMDLPIQEWIERLSKASPKAQVGAR